MEEAASCILAWAELLEVGEVGEASLGTSALEAEHSWQVLVCGPRGWEGSCLTGRSEQAARGEAGGHISLQEGGWSLLRHNLR